MGHTQTEIWEIVGVHKTTFSRELGRNKGLQGGEDSELASLVLVGFGRRNRVGWEYRFQFIQRAAQFRDLLSIPL